MHYTCITCTAIDSVIKIAKKDYPQVYSEEYQYRVKKIQMSRFVSSELDSDSESHAEAESKSDAKLMTKSKPESDSE